MNLPEPTNTDRLAEVDVASDRRGADVEPVVVGGRQLLGDASLDGVDPAYAMVRLLLVGGSNSRHTGDGQLALALQEGRVGFLLLVSIVLESITPGLNLR